MVVSCQDKHLSLELWGVCNPPSRLDGILGIRFGSYPILTDDMSFKLVCELLGIPLPLTTDTKRYFGPTASP